MIIAKDTEGSVYLFASTKEAEYLIRTIDIEHGEYQFCDTCDQKYRTEVIQSHGLLRKGKFKLRAVDNAQPNQALDFLRDTKFLASRLEGITTLEKLRNYIQRQNQVESLQPSNAKGRQGLGDTS